MRLYGRQTRLPSWAPIEVLFVIFKTLYQLLRGVLLLSQLYLQGPQGIEVLYYQYLHLVPSHTSRWQTSSYRWLQHARQHASPDIYQLFVHRHCLLWLPSVGCPCLVVHFIFHYFLRFAHDRDQTSPHLPRQYFECHTYPQRRWKALQIAFWRDKRYSASSLLVVRVLKELVLSFGLVVCQLLLVVHGRLVELAAQFNGGYASSLPEKSRHLRSLAYRGNSATRGTYPMHVVSAAGASYHQKSCWPDLIWLGWVVDENVQT